MKRLFAITISSLLLLLSACSSEKPLSGPTEAAEPNVSMESTEVSGINHDSEIETTRDTVETGTKGSDVTTTPTDETTQAPEEWFEGCWQGSDSYETRIVIRRDKTFFYCELGSPKYVSIRGTDGMWMLDSDGNLRLSYSFPEVSYVLQATPDYQNDQMKLTCINGSFWNDEILTRMDSENTSEATTLNAKAIVQSFYKQS